MERRECRAAEAMRPSSRPEFSTSSRRPSALMTLDVASALADVLDEVEVFVAADLLDTDEHGWCPGSPVDTMANPRESSAAAGFLAGEAPYLAPQFCRGR